MNQNYFKELFSELIKIQTNFNLALDDIAQSMSLNRSELLILLDVVDHPNTSLNDVCRRAGLKKSAASKIVEHLVQSHYLSRETCPTNRREMVLLINKEALDDNFCTTQITQKIFNATPVSEKELALSLKSLKEISKFIKKEKENI